MRAGAHAFMTKPIVVEKLLETLAEIAEGATATLASTDVLPALVENDTTVVSQHLLQELREMGLGEEFVRRFLGECVRDARKCIADLEVAGTAAHWDAFRDACHALKGAAGNMGAVRLADNASEGMGMPADQLNRQWKAMCNQLRQQLEQAYAGLRERGDVDDGQLAPESDRG